MTETEKRRIKLLQDMKKTYSVKTSTPAVHPRYQSAYRALYTVETEENKVRKGTFLMRAVISILLFILFVVMDYREEKIGNIDSHQVIEAIRQEGIQSYFKNGGEEK